MLDKSVKLESLHEHELVYVEDMVAAGDGDPEWCCNGVEIFEDGCKSGQKDLGIHEGIKCWRSTGEDADYDLCENCIRWVIHCLENDEDMGLD